MQDLSVNGLSDSQSYDNTNSISQIKFDRIYRYFPILISEIYKSHNDSSTTNSPNDIITSIYDFGLAFIKTFNRLVIWNYQLEHPYKNNGNFLLEIQIETSVKNKRKSCCFELFMNSKNTISAMLIYVDGYVKYWRNINESGSFICVSLSLGGTFVSPSIVVYSDECIFVFSEFNHFQLLISSETIVPKVLTSSLTKYNSLVNILSPWSYWKKQSVQIKYLSARFIQDMDMDKVFIIQTSDSISLAILQHDTTNLKIEAKINAYDLIKEIHWSGSERYDIKSISICSCLFVPEVDIYNNNLFILLDVNLVHLNDDIFGKNIILVKCNNFDINSISILSNFTVSTNSSDQEISTILLSNKKDTLIVAFNDSIHFVHNGIFETFHVINSICISSMVYISSKTSINDKFIVCTWPHGLFEMTKAPNSFEKQDVVHQIDTINTQFNVILDENISDKCLRMFYNFLDNNKMFENNIDLSFCSDKENFFMAVKSNISHLTSFNKNDISTCSDFILIIEKKLTILNNYLLFFKEVISKESSIHDNLDFVLISYIFQTYEMLIVIYNIEDLNRSLLLNILSDCCIDDYWMFSPNTTSTEVFYCFEILQKICAQQKIFIDHVKNHNVDSLIKLWSSIKLFFHLVKAIENNPCDILYSVINQNTRIIPQWRNASSLFYDIIIEQVKIIENQVINSSKWLPAEHQIIKIEIAHIIHVFVDMVLNCDMAENPESFQKPINILNKLVSLDFTELASNLSEKYFIFDTMFQLNHENECKMRQYRLEFNKHNISNKFYNWCFKNSKFKKMVEFYSPEDGNIEQYLEDQPTFYWIYLFKNKLYKKCINILIELSNSTLNFNLKKFYLSTCKLILFMSEDNKLLFSSIDYKIIENALNLSFHQDQIDAIKGHDNKILSIEEMAMFFVHTCISNKEVNEIQKSFDLCTYLSSDDCNKLTKMIWKELIFYENWVKLELSDSLLFETLKATFIFDICSYMLSDKTLLKFIPQTLDQIIEDKIDEEYLDKISSKNLTTSTQIKQLLNVLFKMIHKSNPKS